MTKWLALGILSGVLSSGASASVEFSSGGPNQLTVTFTKDIVVTITPPANRVFGEFANMFSFKNAFSSAPSGHSVEPLTLGVNEITTFSTGTYLAGNITPASADISFRQGGQGLNVGTVNGTDFFIGLLGDTYIPAGGQGLVTFPAGSVTITNWTGAIPDNIVTQVDVVSRSDGSLTPNTTLMFVDPTPPEPPVIESFSRNPATGLLSLSFKSSASKTYSIFGGESLNNIASWSEISTTDITDNGGSASFTYTPAGSPLKYFLQVRED